MRFTHTSQTHQLVGPRISISPCLSVSLSPDLPVSILHRSATYNKINSAWFSFALLPRLAVGRQPASPGAFQGAELVQCFENQLARQVVEIESLKVGGRRKLAPTPLILPVRHDVTRRRLVRMTIRPRAVLVPVPVPVPGCRGVPRFFQRPDPRAVRAKALAIAADPQLAAGPDDRPL